MTVHANEPASLPVADQQALLRLAGRDGRRPQLQTRATFRVAVLAAALTPIAVLAGLGVFAAGLRSFIAYAALLLLLDLVRRPWSRRLRVDAFDEARDVLLNSALAAMIVLSARAGLANTRSDAAEVLDLWLATAALLVPSRLLASHLEARRRRARGGAPALIVGAGRVGALTAKRLLNAPEYGLRPIGFLDKTPLDGSSNGLPVLGASWDLEKVVRAHGVRHVIFTFSTAPHDVLLRMVNRCYELGVSVSLVPRLFERIPARLAVDHVGGLPLLSLFPSDPLGWRMRLKYASDRALAALLLVVTLPVLCLTAAAVVASLGRPILFRQRRAGRDGQEFEILKFRTMRGEAGEAEPILPPDTAPGGVEASDRRTAVGKLLRRTSIDELPQLFNVLRGEMSLVGPRPERPQYVARFERNIYRYSDRMRVKSGITGWAQIHGLRGQTSLNDRVEWDNYYIENWSFWLDMKILIQTARLLLAFRGD